MSEQPGALLDTRDRFVAHLADYDVKALTLLFSIAAAWGIIKATSLPAAPMLAIFLAFAGLFVSVGWVVQRRQLWRGSYAEVKAGTDGRLVPDPVQTQPAASAGAPLHYGEPLSMVVFALLTAVAIWSYQGSSPLFAPDVAGAAPEEDAGGMAGEPDLIQAIPLGDGEHMVLLSPYQMEVLRLTSSDDVECPCDREHGVTSGPASYGPSHYASIAGHMPFDPNR